MQETKMINTLPVMMMAASSAKIRMNTMAAVASHIKLSFLVHCCFWFDLNIKNYCST